MLKKSAIYSLVFLFSICIQGVSITHSETTADIKEPSYTKLRDIDKGTFNEYRYRLTEQYFKLREKFQIDGILDESILREMASLAEKGYNYLPDNLSNKNLYNNFLTEVARGIKYPENDTSYTSVIKALQSYVEDVKIDSVKGTIEVNPDTGNAPLTVTLRAKVTDPTGTKIPDYNYVWWIDNAGKKEVIGRKLSLTYVIKEEGKTSIFLDVVSNHKNEAGYTDVLPFSSRKDIDVREKVASVIIKVNGDDLRNREVLKFNPEDSGYGLIFDATSSTPTSGSKFISTKWNFGNGVKREYDGGPKIERITYKTEGEFTVTLTLKTNELKTVERKFVVSIHKPIASITTNSEEGFIGDKFTFKAKAAGSENNLTYDWEIIDIDSDKVILKKDGSAVTHTFLQKGKYNVKLHVIEPSGDDDIDSKIIYINSRPPVADFSFKISKANQPNTIFLDATKSHDPDFSDDGKLLYNWIINGVKVNLENSNEAGSIGYYTFSSVGDHSVSLEVTDPDGISSLKTQKVSVKSILALDFAAYPRVIQREQFIKFVAESKEADFFEWDFGDGSKDGGDDAQITHTYEKSGMFDARLTVRDKDGNTNTYVQKVYVGDSLTPYAFIKVGKGTDQIPELKEGACNGKDAYIVDKVDAIKFDASESIDIDGDASGMSYSWKIGQSKYVTSKIVTHKFDELGCFPIKLTVTSEKNGKSSSSEIYVKVENRLPEFSSLTMSMVDPNTDPVVVVVTANGAKDPDGVVQSYLWYYYTDTDSEPQDFRATTKATTTFVLPKVTGNYFFVLVMKDNSDARVSSEEISESRYSLTLSGDNVNTPLIDLSVSDSSVSIGDEVSFTANVKNILGKDISSASEYFWDFDGDGFYDKETKENTTVYKYNKSGEFFAKVKVKHKGFSNVRNTSIAVSNKLLADFDYISIGNDFVFINKSAGQVDDFTWDLGDGNRIIGKEHLQYTYTDKTSSHIVNLKITEGGKTKEVEKKVVVNPKNILKAKKEGLNVFTSPEIGEANTITLKNPEDSVHVYMGASKGTIGKYAIDFDTEFDSDVNGGKDDDIDNNGTPSLNTGDVAQIILNQNKVQKVKLFTMSTEGVILDTYEFTIVKEYITEQQVNVGEIVFEGVSEEEKELLEKLKELVNQVPDEYKKEAISYVQRLKEEYGDAQEKAKVVIDFESFLDNPNIKNADAIISVLEEIIAYGQDDKSEKGIAYGVLVALLPESFSCSVEGTTQDDCKTYVISKLDEIKQSTDIEKNKQIGGEILTIIGGLDVLTNKDKLDFKAVLKTLVYGGVNKIPQDEKNEVTDEQSPTTSDGLSLATGLKMALYGVLILFAILLVGGVGFYIFYKVGNEDDEISFKDFIASKTGGKTVSQQKDSSFDILGQTQEVKTDSQNSSLPQGNTDPLADQKQETVTSQKQETVEDTQVPDWLKGAAAPVNVAPNEPTSLVESTDILDTPTTTAEQIQTQESQTSSSISETAQENNIDSQQTDTQSQDGNNLIIPDWLKGSGVETAEQNKDIIPNPLTPETSVMSEDDLIISNTQTDTQSISPETPVTSQDTVASSSEELQVPDWLKGSALDLENTSSDTGDVQEVSDKTQDKVSEESASAVQKSQKTTKKATAAKKTTNVVTKKTTAKKTTKKEEGVQDEILKKADDLWQDGMEIPDWLKDTTPKDDNSSKKS